MEPYPVDTCGKRSMGGGWIHQIQFHNLGEVLEVIARQTEIAGSPELPYRPNATWFRAICAVIASAAAAWPLALVRSGQLDECRAWGGGSRPA